MQKRQAERAAKFNAFCDRVLEEHKTWKHQWNVALARIAHSLLDAELRQRARERETSD